MIRKHLLFPEFFAEEDVLQVAGNAPLKAFGHDIRLLSWNIYKGRNRTWQDNFLYLMQDRNLAILQESVFNTRYDDIFRVPDRMEWVMAKTYRSRRTQAVTGVKTGSSVESTIRQYYLSPDAEPVLRTPKMLLATLYPLEGRSDLLLVVNIHAINFVSLDKFNRQIAQIVQAIEHHKGPVILAGDFNTWNRPRYKSLKEIAHKMELTEVPLRRRGRWHYLNQDVDFVFYRGLTLIDADVLTSIRSSDHYPIKVDFSLA